MYFSWIRPSLTCKFTPCGWKVSPVSVWLRITIYDHGSGVKLIQSIVELNIFDDGLFVASGARFTSNKTLVAYCGTVLLLTFLG